MKSFKIGKKIIGSNKRAFIVAEISGNHKGNIKNAIKLIDEAKKAGADAVKLQTYTASTITLNSTNKDFQISDKSPWKKFKNFWNLYNYAHTPLEWHKKLFQHAKKIDIEIFSSPFDESSVDFLEKLNCPAYKIASPEINHHPLIEKVAKTKKPVILSTGLSNFDDIKEAVNILKSNNCKKIVILKCCSSYPAKIQDLNLITMKDIQKKFSTLCGFSDHTIGFTAPIVAATLGANIIEKHITYEKNTVDSFFSMDADEFKKMIGYIRNAELSIGKISYKIPRNSKVSLEGRRSIYVSKKISKGEKLSKKNIKIVRPSYSLSPKYYKKIIGKRVNKNLDHGSRISLKDIIK